MERVRGFVAVMAQGRPGMAGGYMSRKYFGTDGIRGRANGLITPELALKVGQAAGLVFQRGDHRHRVVIGKDTRLSGYMIEYAMVAGFTSVGMDVLLLGPIPTPAVAMLTKSMRADLGVMISASHNLFEDNGIKLFGPQGFKLSDDVEKQIEQLMDESLDKRLAQSASLGRARRIDGVHDRYIEFAKRTLPRDLSLDGLRVVVDCANGAAYRARAHAGRRPLRARTDAEPRLQPRRRALRSHHSVALRHHRRRFCRGAAGARGGAKPSPAGVGGLSPLRPVAADPEERARAERQAARRRRGQIGHRRRRKTAQRPWPLAGPLVRYRACDPRDGRG